MPGYGNQQRYSLGNKVYSGGSPQANVGPVDKTGYKEREANGKAKRLAVLRKQLIQARMGSR